MTFTSFDPRKEIRTVITIPMDIFQNGKDIYIIPVIDTQNNTYLIPIYTTEKSKSNELPPLPFIEFGLLSNIPQPQDIGASTRKHECIIDVNIYWQEMDNMEPDDFGKLISDKLSDLIRTNQCGTVTGTHFISISGGGRILIENYARQVVYHKNMEIYVLFYDAP
jgi:hypothetical protein